MTFFVVGGHFCGDVTTSVGKIRLYTLDTMISEELRFHHVTDMPAAGHAVQRNQALILRELLCSSLDWLAQWSIRMQVVFVSFGCTRLCHSQVLPSVVT
jgi:hypothetical protein